MPSEKPHCAYSSARTPPRPASSAPRKEGQTTFQASLLAFQRCPLPLHSSARVKANTSQPPFHSTPQSTPQVTPPQALGKMAEAPSLHDTTAPPPDAPSHTYKFNITMTCTGCSGAVERVLKRLDGTSIFLSTHPPLFLSLQLRHLPLFPNGPARLPTS